MFVPRYGFTLTEHDEHRPWIVVRIEHRTVVLEAGIEFFAWARERWPANRFTVQLDPWQLTSL